MDGYEVARRIRADGDGNVPQLIALTGWGQDQDYRRSQLAGFDHHLVKPPNIQRLRSLLRGV
jgi:CheY-like chemotaxis protein